MGTITSLADITEAIKTRSSFGVASTGSGQYAITMSLDFLSTGGFITPQGSPPSTAPGTTYSGASTGALSLYPLQTGEDLYVLGGEFKSISGSMISLRSVLIDLLAGVSTDPSSGSLQSLNTVSLPRYTDGDQVAMLLIPSGALYAAGTNTLTATITYKDETNTTRTTSLDLLLGGGNQALGSRCWKVPINGASRGIRQIVDITYSGTLAAAGTTIYAMLYRPILGWPGIYDESAFISPLMSAIPKIQSYGESSPCLTFLRNASLSLTYTYAGSIILGVK